MKWSVKLFKIFGIPVKIHYSFFLLVIVLLYFFVSSGLGSLLFSLVWIIAIFAVVLVHELTHSIVGRYFGYQVKNITLLPIGGVAQMKEIPEKPIAEIIVAASGPLINIVIGIIALIAALLIYGEDFINTVDFESYTFARMFISFNFIMAGFNLLPIFPMDGGRVLRGLLGLFIDYHKATHWAAEIGRFMAILMIITAVFFKQFWIVIIGIFIFFGSRQEEQMSMLRHILSKYCVRDVYTHTVISFRPGNQVFEVSDRVIETSQEYFPIIDQTGIIGVVSREKIFKSYYEGNLRIPVSDLMSEDYVKIKENEDLFRSFIKMMEKKAGVGIVYDSTEFKGILTLREINNIYHLMKS